MNLIELSVKRPIATSVIYIFICGAGLLAWTRLPQEVMPDLNFPQLTIVTSYAQAAPQEIENLVTKPIEEAVGTVKNVRRVRSVSKEGTSIVTVEFSWGTNMDFASLNTREKLDLVKSRLPSETKEPTIIKYNPFYTPVLILSLNSEGSAMPEILSHIAQNTVANKLQKIEGVAAVQLSGISEKEIHLDLSQDRLAANHLSILQFNRGLAAANYRGAAGTAKEGTYDYSVRVVTPFDSNEDIKNAIISVDNPNERQQPNSQDGRSASYERQRQRAVQGDQRLIPVSNVGVVSEGFKERSSYSRYDGKDNITIMIQKQANASTIATARHLKAAVKELKPLLPSDVSLEIIYDQAVIIQKGIHDVLRDTIMGGVLAFLILFFFLKSWRDATIVTVVIPASALITIIVMNMMGMSLNTISMGGLALGIGMLVDVSICVTENIHRRRDDLKEPLETAVIEGTGEVAGAVISSSLSSIAVFLPLLFVLGLMGQLFKDLSLTVTISHLVSIIVSITLVPMLAVVLGEPKNNEQLKILQKDLVNFDKLKSWYLKKLEYSFDHPKKVWGGIGGLFLAALLVFHLIPLELMPHVDVDQIVCALSLPNGTRLDRTDEITRQVDEEIRNLKDVSHTTVTVGSSSDSPLVLLGKNDARILVDLKKKRSQTADQIIAQAREKISNLDMKGARLSLNPAGGPLSFGQGQSSAFMVYLKGYDLEKLRESSDALMENLKGVKGLVQVRNSFSMPAPEVQLTVDKERAARAGLTVTDIGQAAMAAYHGKNVTQIYKEGKEIQVRVRLREEDRQNSSALHTLLLPTSNGGTIPLQDVANLEIGEGPSQIERIDQARYVLVQGDRSRAYGSASDKAIQRIVDSFSVPDITLEVAGEKKEQQESFVSLAVTVAVSLLLVFMVMAIEFESLLQPFLILFTIPLSLIGMAFGLFLMGKTMNAVAGMGFLLLAGIVVNNGIVLIDFVNTVRKEKTLSTKEALIEACQTRLRPILLTATTTIIGLIPLALGIGEGAELQAPMAITVIFGLAVATVLTLVALPTLFMLVESRLPRMSQSGIHNTREIDSRLRHSGMTEYDT